MMKVRLKPRSFGFRSKLSPVPHLALQYMGWLVRTLSPTWPSQGEWGGQDLNGENGRQGLPPAPCKDAIHIVGHVNRLEQNSIDCSGNGIPHRGATQENAQSASKTQHAGWELGIEIWIWTQKMWLQKCNSWFHHSPALWVWASHSTAWACLLIYKIGILSALIVEKLLRGLNEIRYI